MSIEEPEQPVQPEPQPQPAGPEQPGQMSADERLWGMLCHLLALSGFIGIPLGFVLGPLVAWLIKKDQYPFVNDQGKESINFQISMLIYGIISGVLIFVVIGIPLLIAVAVVDIIYVIVASIAANDGRAYRYPLTIRFLK